MTLLFRRIADTSQLQEHLLHSKSNGDKLQDFTTQLAGLKNDLTSLLSHQAVLILSSHTDTLARIESRLEKNRKFYASIHDSDEDNAIKFVSKNGGEEVVQMVSTVF
jgi:hypothetical protein